MKRFGMVVTMLVLSALLAAPGTAKEWKKVRIATEGAYAPWNFTDSSGKLDGFEIELAELLCKRLNLSYEMMPQAWDGIIPSLQAGKYDVIIAAMSITEKRKKAVSFSRYYAATPTTFIVPADGPHKGFKTALSRLTLGEVDDAEKADLAAIAKAFKGAVIGVQSATIQERFLLAYLEGDVKIRTYDSQENLELDLEAGRVDAALGAMSYWVPKIESGKATNLEMVGPGMTGGPFGAGVGVAVRKADADLAALFSKGIDQLIEDGTLSKLAIKWFTFDASAKR